MLYDTESFKKYLEDTLDVVVKHRAEMIPEHINTDDELGTVIKSTASPLRAPLSITCMEAADAEAAVIGDIAYHCMLAGTLPPRRMSCFYWKKMPAGLKKCQGLRGEHSLDEFEDLLNLMSVYASGIVTAPGMEFLLERAADTRRRKSSHLLRPSDRWISLRDAMELTNRSAATIREWGRNGVVSCIRDDEGDQFLYSERQLRVYITALESPEVFNYQTS